MIAQSVYSHIDSNEASLNASTAVCICSQKYYWLGSMHWLINVSGSLICRYHILTPVVTKMLCIALRTAQNKERIPGNKENGGRI